MKRRILGSFTVLLICVVLFLLIALPALAKTEQSLPSASSEMMSILSLSGYGTTGGIVSGSGSFTVTASGTGGLLGDEIKIASYNSSTGNYIVVSIKKPDDTYFKNSVEIPPNGYDSFRIYFAEAGTYTIEYAMTGSSALTAEFNP